VEKNNTIDNIITKQNVRLLDVFVLAPFLWYAGTKQTDNTLKYGLYLVATLTFLYNGINYLENKKYAN
jgi:hypothetical protein